VKGAVIDTRKAIDGQAMGLMLLLCIIWGLQQVVLKAAAPEYNDPKRTKTGSASGLSNL